MIVTTQVSIASSFLHNGDLDIRGKLGRSRFLKISGSYFAALEATNNGTYLARLTEDARGLDAGGGDSLANFEGFARVLHGTIGAAPYGECWCGELACGTGQ